MNAESKVRVGFPSGRGAKATHATHLSDGRPNPSPKAGTPYEVVTAREIVRMAADPPSVPKDEARWFIPSTYAESDARDGAVQRERGRFAWLALDVDEGNHDRPTVADAVRGACGRGVRFVVYSSRSATADDRRWRVLIPLAETIPGADYAETQLALFELVSAYTDGALVCDTCTARPAQLVYLPNRGEFYEHLVARGEVLSLGKDHAIIQRRERTRRDRAEAEAEAAAERDRRAAERAARRTARGDDGGTIIEKFNAAHTVEHLLDRYGYTPAGNGRDWRSPMQTSKSFLTRDHGDHWVSISATDGAAGIGAPTKSGYRFGDAFDLFRFYEHDDDVTAAVGAYASEIDPPRSGSAGGGGSWTDFNDARPDAQRGGGAATSDGAERPNAAEEIDLSHDALACDIGRRGWDRDAKHVAAWGRWLFWTGARWEADDRLANLTQVRAFLRARAEDLVAWAERKAAATEAEKGEAAADRLRSWAKTEARTLRSKTTVAAVEHLARANPASVAAPDDFDADRMLLGTPGGVVDLRTGALRPARREDMMTKQAAAAPEHGRPERWLRFLAEIFDGDAALIEFMQRAAGYALTGETREHKLLFLYGTGRNGKSVFMNTLFDLMGEYSRRASADAFLNNQGSRHSTVIAGLHGARLVVGSELPKGKTWDEAIIKDLTGGDVMTANFMRQDYFDFSPQLTLMIAGNTMPSFRGVDEAIRARVVLVPFNVTIPPEQRDQGLPHKLREEWPRILAWAIEGAVAWNERGLDVPQRLMDASQEYFDDEDMLGQFLADETEADPGGFVTTSALHDRFGAWCTRQGLSAWTLMTMQKEMKSRGFEAERRHFGRGFKDLKLNPSWVSG